MQQSARALQRGSPVIRTLDELHCGTRIDGPVVTSLSDWLDARDGEAMARAWAELDVKRVVVCDTDWRISKQGAARLAAAFLGVPLERLAWIDNEVVAMGPPTYTHSREATYCFLEDRLDLGGPGYEYFTLHELREGERGIQHVSVGYQQSDGTRDGTGGGGSVVRIFDRSTGTGVSMVVGKQTVSMIGEFDLSALDLFDNEVHFDIASGPLSPLDTARDLAAQLAALVDPLYADAASWPVHAERTSVTPDTDPASPGSRYTTREVSSGDRRIELSEVRNNPPWAKGVEDGWATATVRGLPWGHSLNLTVYFKPDGMKGRLQLRLPIVLGRAVIDITSR